MYSTYTFSWNLHFYPRLHYFYYRSMGSLLVTFVRRYLHGGAISTVTWRITPDNTIISARSAWEVLPGNMCMRSIWWSYMKDADFIVIFVAEGLLLKQTYVIIKRKTMNFFEMLTMNNFQKFCSSSGNGKPPFTNQFIKITLKEIKDHLFLKWYLFFKSCRSFHFYITQNFACLPTYLPKCFAVEFTHFLNIKQFICKTAPQLGYTQIESFLVGLSCL